MCGPQYSRPQKLPCEGVGGKPGCRDGGGRCYRACAFQVGRLGRVLGREVECGSSVRGEAEEKKKGREGGERRRWREEKEEKVERGEGREGGERRRKRR